MQTLDRTTLIWPDLRMPSCEQVLTGNADSETESEESGHLGGADLGVEPEPLQGESESPEVDERTGDEGAGT